MSVDNTNEFGHLGGGDRANRSGVHLTGHALVDEIRTGTCKELAKIGSTVQSELCEGIADTMESILAEQPADAPGREELDALTSSIRSLAHQVAVVFDIHIHMLGRREFLRLDIGGNNNAGEAACRVTVEEFMQSVKPPVRSPTLRERIEPYVRQLERLRDAGYAYALCAQFLRENGIKISPATVSLLLSDARARARKAD